MKAIKTFTRAGLDQPSSGEIWIGDRQANSIPARSRDVAMVFQSYALYPHMSCYENLALNLVLKKTPRREIDRRVHETAQMLEIEDLPGKKPRELSGGLPHFSPRNPLPGGCYPIPLFC